MPAPALSLVIGSLLAFSPWSMRDATPHARAHATLELGPAAEPATEPAEAPADAPTEDNGWGEEDEVEPASTTPPPATQPVPTTPAPAPAPFVQPGFNPDGSIIKKPAPPPDARKGIGLLVAAGATGALAWGVAGARIGLVNRCVDLEVSTLLSCIRELPTALGLTVLVWLANDATYALGPAAGLVRGRYEASEYVYSGKYDRKSVAWTATGGTIFGVGLVAKISLWAMTFNVLKCEPPTSVDPGEIEAYGDCLRRRLTGLLVGHQFASGMIAGGAGAMTFGIIYGKERRSREKLFFRPEQVRIVPDINFNSMGFALVGRF